MARSAEARLRPEDMANLIRQGIREHVLTPGQQLVQDDLARRFGVSRNPVREALRMLAAEGLVSIAAGDGAVVRSLSESDLDELYQLRIVLEPLLAPRIVERAREADLTKLQAIAQALDAPQPVEVWLRGNYRFHVMLYALADSPHSERILTNLLTLVQPYSLINVERLDGRDPANSEHLEMVDAIRDRDAKRLGALFAHHLEAARERLLHSAPSGLDDDKVGLLRGLGR